MRWSTPGAETHEGVEDHCQNAAVGGCQDCRASSTLGWGLHSGWRAIGVGVVVAISCAACEGAGGGGSGNMRRLRTWGSEQQARVRFQRWVRG
eukprot:8290678-Pyramimonas_sp.AAC.1